MANRKTAVRGKVNRRSVLQAGAGLAVTAGIGACSRNGSDPEPGGPPATVFRNGIVLPVDSAFSEHSAFAIQGERIIAVGDDAHVSDVAGAGATIIDLAGRTVLPGFIEPHMHFALMAGIGHFPDISAFKYPTLDDTLRAIAEIRDRTPPGSWVSARQFDPILLEPVQELTTRELDEVVPDHPVWILNASGHIAYANSLALELGGITADTQDAPGAEFGRYADGTPNGILYGPGAHLPVIQANKAFAERLESGYVDAGVGVGDSASSLGITTLCDMATGGLAGPGDVDAYRAMFATGRMKTRVRAALYDAHETAWEQAGIRPNEGDGLFRISGWKMVTDGSNQGYTGRQREPYVNSDSLGLFYIEPGDLKRKVALRAGQGWPLALHGNGDAAIDSILDAMEAAKADGIDVESLRCRIEHCSILHDEQIERMAALNMGASFLINHVHFWGHVMRDRVFGPEKVQLLDRCKSVEDAGITYTNQTDAPVSPLGSLHKIRVAVARDLWKEPDTVLAPQERVTVESAIRAVTINAAWQCHSEHEIGSLEAGKHADFVILDKDPRSVEPTAISDIGVSETWMNGERTFGG